MAKKNQGNYVYYFYIIKYAIWLKLGKIQVIRAYNSLNGDDIF